MSTTKKEQEVVRQARRLVEHYDRNGDALDGVGYHYLKPLQEFTKAVRDFNKDL